MTGTRPVRAVLFDLDGTLVDSEIHTDQAISRVLAQYGLDDFRLPHTETRGRTWNNIADAIRARTGINRASPLVAADLLDHWNAVTTDVKPVPGAPEAVRAAARRLKLGIVSSSPRSVIDSFLDKLGVGDCFDRSARIGGDVVHNGKPDPEGYLLAARAVNVDPAETLVFEDSRAGLMAARAAGMRSVFVTCCASDIAENTALATATCTHYRTLPPGFWDRLADGDCDLTGKSFT
ncbi:MAG: HAD family phosphatase [Steroidobacteraceae bacterium]